MTTNGDGSAALDSLLQELGMSSAQMVRSIKRVVREDEVDRSPATHPAAVKPCATCPWVVENAVLPHPDGWFDETAKARYWDNIRTGKEFPCHKTYMPEAFISPAAAEEGWAATSEHSKRRECAGGLALMQRELELRDRLGSQETYFNVRGPYGVSEGAFNHLRSRMAGAGGLPAQSNRQTQDRLHVDWIPWPVVGGEVAVINPPCDCAVCTKHAEAHLQLTLVTTDGDEIGVDEGIAGLVQWLWDQGAVTVGSCQSMGEAIERLWPEKRELILSENNGTSDDMNYRKIITSDLAFIRGLIHPAFDDLADAVESLCHDHEVAEWGPGIHVAFPLADADRLLEKLTAP